MEVEVEAVEPVVTLEPDSSRIQVSTLSLLTLIMYVFFSFFLFLSFFLIITSCYCCSTFMYGYWKRISI